MMRCERCFGNGVYAPASLVVRQRDSAIALNPVIGLCAKHYAGLKIVYADLGWRRVKA